MKRLFIFLWLCTVAASALEIPRLKTAPVIDGSPDDAAWKQAGTITRFLPLGQPKVPWQAKVWYGCDDNFFYALFICEHGDIKNIAAAYTEHDGKIYYDDEVEVFLDAAGRRRDYYQVLVNSKGAVFDLYVDKNGRRELSWDSDVRAVGKILDNKAYCVEMAIPLASMNFSENSSGDIGLAFCRVLNSRKDYKYALGEFHRIETWTRFKCPVRYPVRLEKADISLYGGKHVARFHVRNLTKQPLRLTGAFDGRSVACELAGDQLKVLEFPVQHQAGADTHHRLVLKSGKQEVVHFYRHFKAKELLVMTPRSAVLYRGEPLKIELILGEEPSAPLTVKYLSREGKVIWRKEVKLSARSSELVLPFSLPEARVSVSYKGFTPSVVIRSVERPWK